MPASITTARHIGGERWREAAAAAGNTVTSVKSFISEGLNPTHNGLGNFNCWEFQLGECVNIHHYLARVKEAKTLNIRRLK